jgi:hypothetical protein
MRVRIIPVASTNFTRPAIGQALSLYCEKVGLDCRRTAKAPQERGQSKHQLAFDCRSGIVIRDDGGFEGGIIVCILDIGDNGLGGQPMAIRICTG